MAAASSVEGIIFKRQTLAGKWKKTTFGLPSFQHDFDGGCGYGCLCNDFRLLTLPAKPSCRSLPRSRCSSRARSSCSRPITARTGWACACPGAGPGARPALGPWTWRTPRSTTRAMRTDGVQQSFITCSRVSIRLERIYGLH